MPRADTLARFVARVEQNAHLEAIDECCTDDASMQENSAPPRAGQAAPDEIGNSGLCMKAQQMFVSRTRPSVP